MSRFEPRIWNSDHPRHICYRWQFENFTDDDIEKRLLEFLENKIEAKGVKQEKRQNVSRSVCLFVNKAFIAQ